jgi:dTDP-4-dehydrorhamnose 3,5-epimerase
MTATVDTRIDGLIAIEPTVFGDERGFLIESFSIDRWRELGIDEVFVQENHSRSTQRGTLRGMHFQTEPGQGKLVRCPRGAIFDVAVDLRRGSPTCGEWEGHVLDDERHRQLWVPIGFAHGFQVLSEVADVAYRLTSLYDPATESEIAWDDPDVGIEWPIDDPLLSDRDKASPRLVEIADELPFEY